LLVTAAVAYPLMQKRHHVRSLTESTEQARQRASAADRVRQQLEQAVTDYNYVLTRKYAYPSVVALLDDVTRLLPDDTWLTQLELKTPKGVKDPYREIMLRGESGNAGRLVSLLEDSRLFTQAAPRSPTTKIQPGPGEIFDVGAQLKPLPPPQPMPLDLTAPPPSPPSAPRPRPATPAAPAAAAATPPAAGAASAAAAPGAAPATAPGVAPAATAPAGTAAATALPANPAPPVPAPQRRAARSALVPGQPTNPGAPPVQAAPPAPAVAEPEPAEGEGTSQ